MKLLVILALGPACGPTIAVADNDDTTGSTSGDSDSTAAPSTSGTQASTADATSDASTDDPPTTAQAESSTGLPYDTVELRLDPVFAILDNATGGQTRDFHAIAVTDTGDEIDVTWPLDGPGTLEAGVLTSPESDVPVFDRATISATLDGMDTVAHAAISVRTSGPNTPQLFNLSHPPEPRQLDYRPPIEKLDVFFLVDTVSWADEDVLIPYYDRVMNVIVPHLQAEGLDVQFGSVRFGSVRVGSRPSLSRAQVKRAAAADKEINRSSCGARSRRTSTSWQQGSPLLPRVHRSVACTTEDRWAKRSTRSPPGWAWMGRGQPT